MILLPMLIFFTRAAKMVNMREGFLVLFEWSILITPAVTKNFQLSLIFLYFIAVSYQMYQIDFQHPGTYFAKLSIVFNISEFHCSIIPGKAIRLTFKIQSLTLPIISCSSLNSTVFLSDSGSRQIKTYFIDPGIFIYTTTILRRYRNDEM